MRSVELAQYALLLVCQCCTIISLLCVSCYSLIKFSTQMKKSPASELEKIEIIELEEEKCMQQEIR